MLKITTRPRGPAGRGSPSTSYVGSRAVIAPQGSPVQDRVMLSRRVTLAFSSVSWERAISSRPVLSATIMSATYFALLSLVLGVAFCRLAHVFSFLALTVIR